MICHYARYFSQHKSPPSRLGAVSGMGSADKLPALAHSVLKNQNQKHSSTQEYTEQRAGEIPEMLLGLMCFSGFTLLSSHAMCEVLVLYIIAVNSNM